jgi:hypothetical protein
MAMRNAYKILSNNLETKRRRHRWKDNIITDFTEIVFENLDWIYVAKNIVQWWVLLNTIMKYQDPVLA